MYKKRYTLYKSQVISIGFKIYCHCCSSKLCVSGSLVKLFFFVIGCCDNKVMHSKKDNKIAFQRDFQKIIALRNHNKLK